jgi:hypothetical protein
MEKVEYPVEKFPLAHAADLDWMTRHLIDALEVSAGDFRLEMMAVLDEWRSTV